MSTVLGNWRRSRDTLTINLPQLLKYLIFIALALAAGTQPYGCAARAADVPVVAAASSLQFALSEIAGKFKHDTGHGVRLVFGSSGNFSRQIRQGAPFELFLAADEDYPDKLIEDGFTRDNGVIYARGRIALAIPDNSPLKPDSSLSDLKKAISDKRLYRFAIANPEHAPYGQRAKQALQHQGLWSAIQPKLVLGENVSQAAQFALSANAQGGIIAYSLARSPTLAGRANFTLLPVDYHQPLLQRMVLLKNSGEIAEHFYRYLQQDSAAEILQSYGFDP